MLEIIFENEDYVAINKPHGLLVHRTKLAKDATEFAVQKLRDQIKTTVFPIHRLDRKTSGVLIFAKNHRANQKGQSLFRERKVDKTYVALVRGFLNARGTIDYPLVNNQKIQEALTAYNVISQFEIPLPFNGHQTSRYSLVALKPAQGRYHQLRKHMAHVFHPIIGDRPHGCNKQNKLWKDHFNMTKMLLHAEEVKIPFEENKPIKIRAQKSPTFQAVLNQLSSLTQDKALT